MLHMRMQKREHLKTKQGIKTELHLQINTEGWNGKRKYSRWLFLLLSRLLLLGLLLLLLGMLLLGLLLLLLLVLLLLLLGMLLLRV